MNNNLTISVTIKNESGDVETFDITEFADLQEMIDEADEEYGGNFELNDVHVYLHNPSSRNVVDTEHFIKYIDWESAILDDAEYEFLLDLVDLEEDDLIAALYHKRENPWSSFDEATDIITNQEYRIFDDENEMINEWIELEASSHGVTKEWLDNARMYLNDDEILDSYYRNRDRLPSGRFIVRRE